MHCSVCFNVQLYPCGAVANQVSCSLKFLCHFLSLFGWTSMKKESIKKILNIDQGDFIIQGIVRIIMLTIKWKHYQFRSYKFIQCIKFLYSFLCKLLIWDAQNAPQAITEPLAYGGGSKAALRACNLCSCKISLEQTLMYCNF